MRLRNVPGSREVIAANKYCILEEDPQKGNWSSIFGNENPIHIEVGMGKGRFLMSLARQNPHINYIGIEKYSSVLIRALEKMEEDPLENIRFIRMDAEKITEMFDRDEVSRIYLNFSDPWPKDRHAKRRLTSQAFLKRYDQILKQEGRIEFKTDNRGLFEYSLISLNQYPMDFEYISLDLHNSPESEGNIMTEYERKFCTKGPIYKLIGRYK